jgi:hypothetical protein
MSVGVWMVIAVLAALGVVYVAAHRVRAQLPPIVLPGGEPMPKTRLQRLAAVGLAIVAVCTAVAIGLVWHYGPDVFWHDDTVRLAVTFTLLAGLVAYAGCVALAGHWAARDDGGVDERDRAIVTRAPAGQAGAMLVVLAVWHIALGETFKSTRLVPSYFLYLILWSCIMVSALAWLAGVLLTYRRA